MLAARGGAELIDTMHALPVCPPAMLQEERRWLQGLVPAMPHRRPV